VPFKNTIGVLNEYILNTLDFINKYGHCSENKLYELDCVLDEIESKVLLLEKKLESVPAEIYNTMP
jgi:WASH complex subunit CCDC53